jgi:hypothetical protein
MKSLIIGGTLCLGTTSLGAQNATIPAIKYKNSTFN